MPGATEKNLIHVSSSDVVIAAGANDALVVGFGLDGVLSAVLCLLWEWLENDEGLKRCGQAAQHTDATEDERINLYFLWF